ncbi:hypothetical protein [Conexibacter sp. SYSU D00693]|uniref:hypothetical protein n=1 Tax=Conexibacter sp. SYSU D00693 TaxID=2812560 RepID=UPI00196B0874|nr:hypothetical protein [Conexibacter sp. SYSU D00693]
MTRRTAPPSGMAPPTEADGVDLVELAAEVIRRYAAARPEEAAEYEPGVWEAWGRHDNQHLLNWAIGDARHGLVDLVEQARWLAGVLEARDYPRERLAFDLRLAADVVDERLGDDTVVARLRAAAAAVA